MPRFPVPPRPSAMAVLLAAFGLAGCAAGGPDLVDEPSIPTPHEPAVCMIESRTAPGPAGLVTWKLPSAGAPPGAWCASVGPAFAAKEGGATRVPVDRLVVVTWNVQVGAGDVLRFVEDLRSGALTGAPVESFVLLLQETYRAGPDVPREREGRLTSRIDIAPPSGERMAVSELARRLGLHAFYAPSMPNGAREGGQPEDRGNAILSTLPLSDLAAIELPFEAQRRVAVAGTVGAQTSDGTPWRLRVASGHLDTRSRWSRFLDTFGPGRARQARALAGALEGESVVLGADLNTWSAPFLEEALDVLYQRFTDTPQQEEPTYTLAGVIRRRLDHLLFRLPDHKRAEAWRVDDRYGSDHFPVLGVVRIAGLTASAAPAEPLVTGSAAAAP